MNRELTPEEEDERTTPIGLFNVAVAYSNAADALVAAKLRTGHADSPIRFLRYHAIELFLKSFLLLHGHSVGVLAGRRFGHQTCCLRESAAELGFFFEVEDLAI